MARQIDGLSLSLIAAGGLLAYAGVKGYSLPHALQAFVRGKVPTGPPSPGYAISGGNLNVTSINGVSQGGPQASATASEESFFTAFLHDLGAPVTQANLQDMYSWARKEEPDWPPQNSDPGVLGLWNPLNIGGLGHLSSWPTPAAGAAGTANFLIDNSYQAIVASLRSGNGIVDSNAVASELLAWSGGGYSSVHSGGG